MAQYRSYNVFRISRLVQYQENKESETVMEDTKKYTTWESLPDTLTAMHISEFLGVSRRRIYELFQINVDSGGIPNFEIGLSKRVDKADLKQWINRKKEEKRKHFNLR